MADTHYINNIQAAYNIIKQRKLNTPIVNLHNIKTPNNNAILLKAESLQPSGSFKIRGVTYAISQISAEQKKTGVVAYSTGNHAQAVASAAQQLNTHAVIVMSPNVAKYKVEATLKYGAEVVMADPDSRRAVAEELARTKGYFYIPPFDREDVICGQGTIGLEILEQTDPLAVFVPVGGGGLISGIALAIKHSRPDIKIIGVEPEFENDAYLSFKAGKRIKLDIRNNTIADAIRVPIGEVTFPIILKHVDEMLTVTEEQIVEAMLLCVNHAHLWVEPAAALGVAAAVRYSDTNDPTKPVVCVVSGGNIAPSYFCQLTGQ